MNFSHINPVSLFLTGALSLSMASSAMASEMFGNPGSTGWNSEMGAPGSDGTKVTVKVDGSSRTVDARGEDGSDSFGSGVEGGSATNCRQPLRVAHDLTGAPGGDGRKAGLGGPGGRGGNVRLELDRLNDLQKLKLIKVVNPGGRSGRGGGTPGQGGVGWFSSGIVAGNNSLSPVSHSTAKTALL